MQVATTAWGTLEISEGEVYHFSKGIPGFEQETEFALIEVEDSPFCYLQSVKDQNIGFLLSDPFLFYPSYEFELSDAEAEELGIEGKLIVRCMVTLKNPMTDSTMNLLAPLVLNPENHSAKQIVLHQSGYQPRHRLWNQETNTKSGE
ncbi:flagellar assembly protein FliW [Paenibacillus physcomitrellae]|uniref:Flagellar assembly factor FliW n=1 Tax=Paenibacillus physcomitrellae TaxID=1619311 RepID=A0ABQ1GH99_9BACL|nr:flagellar assembly protein FliW [Paenibacillus physcomitrellae]GGA43672.1 flagellar assembly factor FliW [Paenibacillus physcomitrellae]